MDERPTTNKLGLKPSSETLDDFWMEPYIAACTTVANEIRLFDKFDDSPKSSQRIVELYDFQNNWILDRICRVLVARGLLSLNENNYSLTPLSRTYWVSSSSLYRGESFRSRETWTIHQRVKSALMNGWAPALGGDRSVADLWREGKIDRASAIQIANSMHNMMLASACAFSLESDLKNVRHLLDLGGGIGTFAVEFAVENPHSSATVLDLPPLEAICTPYIASKNLSERVKFVGRNFFEPSLLSFGDCDAILMSNVLHDWSFEMGRELLTKVYATLPVGGAVYVNEMLLDEDRISPTAAVAFDLMIAMTHKGQQYTFLQLQSALAEVGFVDISLVSQFGYYKVIKAIK